MTSEEAEEFARAWLKAWSSRELDAAMAFYAEDCLFIQPDVPGGLKGRDALAAYYEELSAAHPGNVVIPDKIWQIDGGFCVRWYCDLADGKRVRGLELVLLEGRKIVHNEGYFHVL